MALGRRRLAALRGKELPVDEIHDEVLRVFNDVCMPRARQRSTAHGFCPLADVFFEEPTGEIVVRLSCRRNREEIQLYVERRQLTVRGRREFPAGEGRSTSGRDGLRPFERRIRLAVDVDDDKTYATYDEGVLEIRLPLLTQESKVQQVPIKVEAKP
jgi:HSP20 family molecular chaperone IbpA